MFVDLFFHKHASWFGALHIQLSCLLGKRAKTTAPHSQDVTQNASFETILFSNFASHRYETTEATTENRDQIRDATFVFLNGSLLVGQLTGATTP